MIIQDTTNKSKSVYTCSSRYHPLRRNFINGDLKTVENMTIISLFLVMLLPVLLSFP